MTRLDTANDLIRPDGRASGIRDDVFVGEILEPRTRVLDDGTDPLHRDLRTGLVSECHDVTDRIPTTTEPRHPHDHDIAGEDPGPHAIGAGHDQHSSEETLE